MKRYTKRPTKLEHVSLADWAAWYDSRGKRFQKKIIEDWCRFETYDDDNNDDEDENTNQSPKCKKWVKARII